MAVGFLRIGGKIVACRFVTAAKPSDSPRKGWLLLRAECPAHIVLPLLEHGTRKGSARFVPPVGRTPRFEITRWIVTDGAELMLVDLLVKA